MLDPDPPPPPGPPRGFPRSVVIGVAVAACFIVAGRLACRPWFDRHMFWPFYLVRPAWLERVVHVGLAGAGLLLLAGLRAAHRWARALGDQRRDTGRAVLPAVAAVSRLALAAAMAVVATEGILRVLHPVPEGPGYHQYELRVGKRDARFGWAAIPSRTTTLVLQGRPYTYAVNALGFRARAETDQPDLGQPTLVVTGESIASGYGLEFDDTFAARCGHDLGLSVVDVAEGGYGIDQAYLRLQDALARATHPVVVLTTVVLIYLGRTLTDDRPRLVLDDSGTFQLAPPATNLLARSRLRDLWHNRVPYATDADLAHAVAFVQRALRAIAGLSRAHGATPLFVVESQGPDRAFDAHDEAPLLRQLFADPALPFVVVDLDAASVFPRDGHPNPRGARKIADAVEAKLCQLRAPGVACAHR